ncbi:hypothetical protein HYH03_001094 [Edaphochlamys debaryana]|uniref:ATP synthase mitochondrial F1 complex assembly factor 1 n=1 Tax=Edaphochlamys debaryana TaxID=47281 RepID=A0A836C6U8_9CHLO|nr:hypothetical protein HYH03_001094 [Edaphochlamys debaryana]|eukprot:KAG2501294.1 hypothetical protein HYH03_001094 [Edaphochlamys debaryana]
MQQARSKLALACRRWMLSTQPALPALAGSALQAGGHVAGVSGISAPSPTQLDQIVKLDHLLNKSGDEVAEIWEQYHSDPKGGRVGTVMTAADYRTFVQRAKESPMFVLPLARPQGYETLLVQAQLPFVLITGLEEFKRHGESAPPYLTLTHYAELLDSHGLALVRGDVIHDKALSLSQARTIMEVTRAFYVSDEDYPLVHTFNHRPAAFRFDLLLGKLGLPAEP